MVIKNCEYCGIEFKARNNSDRYKRCAICMKHYNKFRERWNGIYNRCKLGGEYYKKGINTVRRTLDSFYNDMFDSFVEHSIIYGHKETSIDRIDGGEDYSKENCRRVTIKEQGKNKRSYLYKYWEVDGDMVFISDIVKLTGCSSTFIYDCFNNGYSLGKTIKECIKKQKIQ